MGMRTNGSFWLNDDAFYDHVHIPSSAFPVSPKAVTCQWPTVNYNPLDYTSYNPRSLYRYVKGSLATAIINQGGSEVWGTAPVISNSHRPASI